MAAVQHIVKRKGHSEPFYARKLYASIYSACLSVRVPDGEAELVAERVVNDVIEWLSNKSEVTAHDIRRQAAEHFEVYNPEAAWMYARHRVHHS
jgi:transcriptional regulator NrdR family protein